MTTTTGDDGGDDDETRAMMKTLQMTFDMLAALEQRIARRSRSGGGVGDGRAGSATSVSARRSIEHERELGQAPPALVIGPESKATQEGAETVWAWARSTHLRVNAAEGKVTGGAAMCADGSTRRITWAGRLRSGEPLPCSVRVGRATVSGHLTLEPAYREGDPAVLKFVINEERTYGRLLPPGPLKGRRKEDRRPHQGDGDGRVRERERERERELVEVGA